MKFLRTWIDWWFFIPVGFALGIGSYWFVPFLLKKLGVQEEHMQYTGTAWLYSLFQALLVFFVGIGSSFLVYRWLLSIWHEYLESDVFDLDVHEIKSPTVRVVIAIGIPGFLLFCFCLICLAVFQ